MIREKSRVEIQVEHLFEAGESYNDISGGSGVSVSTLRRISNGGNVSRETELKIDKHYQEELGYYS